MCQPSLPRMICMPGLSSASRVPSGRWLLIAMMSRPATICSMPPKRLPKATCSALERCWPGKISTAWRWKASSIASHASDPSEASPTPVTVAPSVAWVGSM